MKEQKEIKPIDLEKAVYLASISGYWRIIEPENMIELANSCDNEDFEAEIAKAMKSKFVTRLFMYFGRNRSDARRNKYQFNKEPLHPK